MNRVVESDRYAARRGVASSAVGGSGGGSVDDILKRLGAVELSLGDVRAQVSAITAVIPHLATKADVHDTRAGIQGVRADVNAMETRIIKWIVGTGIASATLASAIASVVAKFVS
jgi:hypothetical protein